eukprot:TRINITY_DN2258_c1_g2_i2.p1 TRINITY_DN2258_c1_g2~~TRINITY_DN2258_c1_g2_i2.p1  ORF type:complete len:317 (+),score=44.72 TRINITY_DN2258_c1_g2_i2:431-1381(+)
MQDVHDTADFLRSDKVKQVRDMTLQVRPVLVAAKDFVNSTEQDWRAFYKKSKSDAPPESPRRTLSSLHSKKLSATFKRDIDTDFMQAEEQAFYEQTDQNIPSRKSREHSVTFQDQERTASLQIQVQRLTEIVDRLSQFSVDAITKLTERVDKLEQQVYNATTTATKKDNSVQDEKEIDKEEKITTQVEDKQLEQSIPERQLTAKEHEVVAAVQHGDDAVLKLLQNQLAVWEDLNGDILELLLNKVMVVLAKIGSSIIVVRSLWRLADLENKQVQVEVEMQGNLLQCLQQLEVDPELQESVQMLIETLGRVWKRENA